jgi:hypothetical protein
MLWQEVANWDRPTQTEIAAAPMAVTLNLNEPIGQARTYLTNQSLTPTGTFLNPTSIDLNVLDQMLVVELSPVPEPAGAAMVVVLCAMPLLRRRRQTA